MKKFSKQEYADLCKAISEGQYNSSFDEEDDGVKIEYMPAIPVAKEKMLAAVSKTATLDLSTIKANQITDQLDTFKYFTMKNFRLRVERHYYYTDSKREYNITIWETKFKTPNGAPCRMDYPVDIGNDSRFSERPWAYRFKGKGYASSVPFAETVEIIRWVQAMGRLAAFV